MAEVEAGEAFGESCCRQKLKPFETFCGLIRMPRKGMVAAAMPSDHSLADGIEDEQLASGKVKSVMDEDFRRRRHRAYTEAYDAWFSGLSEVDRLRLQELDLANPESEQFGPVSRRPVDEFERELQEDDLFGAGEVVNPADIRELKNSVAKAMVWAVQGKTLVEVGQRWLIVMMAWQSPLVAGLALEIDRELAEECVREVGGDDDDGSSGFVLEWVRRGKKISQIGQRAMAAAYVLWPQLIGGLTLEQIGSLNNKTRQAIDKLVQDFRDTFGGVRSRNMRDDEHRITCKNAQLRICHA